jgi:hypothetical protein
MNNTVVEAIDNATNEPVAAKIWFEKSKNKYHIVLGPNSSNRKYVAWNEFANNQDENGEYLVEDKIGGPRTLGTSQPDKKLIPFMTEEDKALYDEIIERAIANKASQKKQPLSEAEKLEKQIAKLQARLAGLNDED